MLTIYSARTGRIRRLVIDAERTDPYLLARHARGVGEAVLPGAAVTQAELRVITGIGPVPDWYVAKFGASHVVDYVMGFNDPDCGDSARPGRTMVLHPRAQPGWRQNIDGTFERSVAVINQEITLLTAQRDFTDSPEHRANEAADPIRGSTPAEIDAMVAAKQAEIDALVLERSARQGPRH